MSVENSQIREPPPLPPVLLEVWPVIAVGALAGWSPRWPHSSCLASQVGVR